MSFDRIRPRDAWSSATDEVDWTRSDPAGKRALFTGGAADAEPVPQTAGEGARLGIDCRNCGERSVVPLTSAVPLLVPSLHLPLLKRDGFSWMKCPACRRRGWVALSLHL